MADEAVTSAKIATGTIQTADLKDGSVTGAKVSNGTIQLVDLSSEIKGFLQPPHRRVLRLDTVTDTYVDVPDIVFSERIPPNNLYCLRQPPQ